MPHAPAAVSVPDLSSAGVTLLLATVFTERDGAGPEGYPAGDYAKARSRGRAQIEVYRTLEDKGLLKLDLARVLADDGTGETRAGMGVGETVPHSLERLLSRVRSDAAIHAGILVENADPIAGPEELEWWIERGVVAIGLAWARSSRYAGGNSSTDGLTAAGREMVGRMDELGVVHDLSHLSDAAMDELLAQTPRPVIASHSNCRALLDTANQRHLRDESIREIARRGGVIGLNLFSPFLRLDGEKTRASIDDCVRHIEHVAEIAGTRAAIGLGSDIDGGFASDRLPLGIDSPHDFGKLSAALRARGWTEAEIAGFCWKNWAHFWRCQFSSPRA